MCIWQLNLLLHMVLYTEQPIHTNQVSLHCLYIPSPSEHADLSVQIQWLDCNSNHLTWYSVQREFQFKQNRAKRVSEISNSFSQAQDPYNTRNQPRKCSQELVPRSEYQYMKDLNFWKQKHWLFCQWPFGQQTCNGFGNRSPINFSISSIKRIIILFMYLFIAHLFLVCIIFV